MKPATSKFSRMLAFAMLLGVALAGCSALPRSRSALTPSRQTALTGGDASGSGEASYSEDAGGSLLSEPSSVASGGEDAPAASSEAAPSLSAMIGTDGELIQTYHYADIEKEVREKGFVVLEEAVELTADGDIAQITTSAAVSAAKLAGADAAANRSAGDSAPATLQAQEATQAMENGLFSSVSNGVDLDVSSGDALPVTLIYQYGPKEALRSVVVACSGYSVEYTMQNGRLTAQADGTSTSFQGLFRLAAGGVLAEVAASDEASELLARMSDRALQDVAELVQEYGYRFSVLEADADPYKAGTLHIRALNDAWEIYRYEDEDEFFIQRSTPKPELSGQAIAVSDRYDELANSFTLFRVVAAPHGEQIAAVYLQLMYDALLDEYSVDVLGVDGVAQLDALPDAGSIAALTALAETSDDVKIGYDTFLVTEGGTYERGDVHDFWQGASAPLEADQAGIDLGLLAINGEQSEPLPTSDADDATESLLGAPFAATYAENAAIMDAVWAAILGAEAPSDQAISAYVQAAISAADDAINATETFVESAFSNR